MVGAHWLRRANFFMTWLTSSGYSQSGPSSVPFLPRHQLQLNNNEWHSEILPSSQSPKDSSPRLPRRNSQTGKDYSAHPTRRPQPSSPPKDYATSLCSTQRELSRGPHISPGLNRNEIPSPRSKQRDRQNSDYSRGSRTRSKSGHRAGEWRAEMNASKSD